MSWSGCALLRYLDRLFIPTSCGSQIQEDRESGGNHSAYAIPHLYWVSLYTATLVLFSLQLLQKTGQIERTVDRDFAEEEAKYKM